MNTEIEDATYCEELYQITELLTIAIHKPWNEINADETALLSKILTSVKQSLNSVRIVHCQKYNTTWLNPHSKVVSFGVPVPMEIQLYEFTRINGASIILADPLGELDDAKKKNLWSALRQMFEL
jgi:hypothetical protein